MVIGEIQAATYYAKLSGGCASRSRRNERLHHHRSASGKAILVSLDGDHDAAVWLPKSQIEYDEEAPIGDEITVTLPEWLAAREGLA